MPREIKEAQIEYAHIQADQGTLQPNGSVGGNVKRVKKKLDVLETEYEYSPPGQSGDIISYPQADNKIPDCFKASGGYEGLAVHT